MGGKAPSPESRSGAFRRHPKLLPPARQRDLRSLDSGVAASTPLESDSIRGVTNVLVVDDEPIVREVVVRYLEREGYRTLEAGDGETARRLLEKEPPSLVVLDVMLPGIDGLELCRWIRARHDLPVILLTARGEEADRIVGLELGADDYVTKPFSPRELAARVRTVLRRTAPQASKAERLVFEELEVDTRTREVTRTGELLRLTAKEFDLLWFMANHPRQVFSRDQLMDRVWGYDAAVDTGTVTVTCAGCARRSRTTPRIHTGSRPFGVWGTGSWRDPIRARRCDRNAGNRSERGAPRAPAPQRAASACRTRAPVGDPPPRRRLALGGGHVRLGPRSHHPPRRWRLLDGGPRRRIPPRRLDHERSRTGAGRVRGTERGGLSARAPEHGPTELAELGTSFNEMAAHIEELFDARRQLVAWASHDLRTPLASMQAMIEALEDGLAEPSHYLPAMREQVRILSLLVDDLFELARIDAGALTLELREAQLAGLVRSCLRGLEAAAQARRVTLRARIDGDPPVICAPDKIERVLFNLLTNALRHTPPTEQLPSRSNRSRKRCA